MFKQIGKDEKEEEMELGFHKKRILGFKQIDTKKKRRRIGKGFLERLVKRFFFRRISKSQVRTENE